jgi:hypothetical protein
MPPVRQVQMLLLIESDAEIIGIVLTRSGLVLHSLYCIVVFLCLHKLELFQLLKRFRIEKVSFL